MTFYLAFLSKSLCLCVSVVKEVVPGTLRYLILVSLFLPTRLYACPFCAEAIRRINNGHLLDSYVVAYLFLAFMPLFLIGLFAWTLYRFHKKKVAAESRRPTSV